MGVTLDRFKKAFGSDVGDDLLAERQRKVREALKELKAAVDTLEAVGASPVPHKDELLYVAIAQILAFVYQLKQYRRGAGPAPRPLGDFQVPEEYRRDK